MEREFWLNQSARFEKVIWSGNGKRKNPRPYKGYLDKECTSICPVVPRPHLIYHIYKNIDDLPVAARPPSMK